MPSRDKGPAERAAERIFCSTGALAFTSVPDKTIPGFAAIIAEEYRPLVEALLGFKRSTCTDGSPCFCGWSAMRHSPECAAARAALAGEGKP